MNIQRIAAFTFKQQGGNPAGVVIANEFPSDDEMLKIAKDLGYSETAFLSEVNDGWRIRFFSPEMEIPFCGHATIASGKALGEGFGAGSFKLYLNQGEISIDVKRSNTGIWSTTFISPNTWSEKVPQTLVHTVLSYFNFTLEDIDTHFPVRFAYAGAKHLILVLKNKQILTDMSYKFDELKALMKNQDLITINLLWPESKDVFHSRNPFPPGGVYEDPATGAAAAAFAGYLRDIGYEGNKNQLEILQGHDMGVPSRLLVNYSNTIGEGIQVSGETRPI